MKAMEDSENQHYLTPGQLRVGLYIHLDLSWLEHPFKFNNFRIRSQAEIVQIKALGLERIRYDPLRSDPAALPVRTDEVPGRALAEEAAQAAGSAQPDAVAEPGIHVQAPDEAEPAKDDRRSRLKALHHAIHECERRFSDVARDVKRIERDICVNPAKNLDEAQMLIRALVDSLLTEGEVVLHAMQPRAGAPDHYVHALNVMVLALILAKTLDMRCEEARDVGLGALFHDIGKTQIPDRVVLKTDPLTTAEAALLRQHPELGARLAAGMGFPEAVVRIILQHHEWCDGTGYPARLQRESIDPLARVVAIVNMYENLCNPANVNDAMTPYEALAHLFAKQRRKLDADVLMLFIKTLGIYPPGSIVELSDNTFGTVISVNPNKPLRPHVLMRAPKVPRDQPLVVNLGETASVTIARCLRPSQLPRDVFEYLAPARRICYFFRTESPECDS